MTELGIRHQLAGILAADVAGYSRLMAADERATLQSLDAARAVFRAAIEANQGRVIDMAGDSVLAVFATAQGAVRAALAAQTQLAASAAGVNAGLPMEFRIGVHLGDVIEKDDGTVYGDGVNTAARLQTKASPGGICLSQSVYDTVKGKVAMRAEFAGAELFKNIAEPVRIWLVQPGGRSPMPYVRRRRWWLAPVAAALVAAAAGGGWYAMQRPTVTSPVAKAADAKSLAVLPFVNMSEDKAMAYFADGVHEDLLTQLALLGDLKVVSRTSVMEYRNSSKNARQIAGELGVAALLEGSVRRAGSQVRVTAQLIDGRADKHLWAKSYDRELKDIFSIQSELATEISRALRVSLAPQEQTRLAKRPTENLEAYDLFLKHQELVNRSAGTVRTATTVKERITLLARAVELDPNFSLAWARLAAERARAYAFDIDRTPAARAQAREAMERALAQAPADPQVKIEAAAYHLYALNDDAAAEKAYQEVLQAAPNHVGALLGLADVHMRQVRIAARVQLLERVLAVDARNMQALVRLSGTYRAYRHFERAAALRRQMIAIRPDEIEQQANVCQIEYWRTGAWDACDEWRRTVAPDAHLKLYRVWALDFNRALARRDFDAALRIVDVVPEELRGSWDEFDAAARPIHRALVLRAKGERKQAEDTARAAMAGIEAVVRKFPQSDGMWALTATGHALLGERQTALAAHEKAVALAGSTQGPGSAAQARQELPGLLALLGDREAALAEISRLLKGPDFLAHRQRVAVELASLWEDPEFLAMVNDPTNNAPLPLP